MRSQWPDIWTGSRTWLQVSKCLIWCWWLPWHSNYMSVNVHAIDFHWKCLLLLWPWQRSNWSGWCMLGSSSINVSTGGIKSSKPKDDSLCHLPKFQMWKNSLIVVTLKTRSRSNTWYALKVSSSCILVMNIKSVTWMVTELWTFVYPFGYNRKI